ncbi:MAG: ATP-dependent DNA helicase RecQ, partial [Thermotogae bacterium]|nr:ATP-dependent DNA helicase RecQ [Thermotogota bacterium]
LTVGEMKEKLFNWFCFDRFLSYDARSRLGNPYRISQEELIRYVIDQSAQKEPKDLFFIAGTGSGKSLIYQYAARYLYEKNRKVTLVVSPIKALMHDQVRSMSDNLSVYLDGDLSYEERNAVHERIKNNEVCLLYISPEMLISNGIASLCPPESIGLVVIDEAHLVLEWGLSFRVDYGYLGRTIHRLRKEFPFPVVATTASAIWGGPMDSVSEISDLLYLNDPRIIYTEIRKKTDLQINRMDSASSQKACSIRALKDEKSIASIEHSVRENKKIIVYMPYATQVNQLLHTLQTTVLESKVVAYTGKSDSDSRKRAFADFRSGKKPVMLATKAFGMGIDIPDVRTVYHLHVPSTLEEYLQEIGRAGRDGDPAIAITDYHPSDPGFAYKLARMSMPQQWKINHLFRHILSLLKEKKGENRFVISLDDVTYLFRNTWNEPEYSAERKARIALLLIEKDLENKYGRPLLSLQSEKYQYVYFALRNPTDSSTVESLPEVAVLSENYSRPSRYAGSPVVSSSKVYQLDIPKLWERAYKDISVKKLLYMLSTDSETVLGCGTIPLVHVAYRYRQDHRVVRNKTNQLWQLISEVCEALRTETKEEDLDTVIAQKLLLFPDIGSMNSAKEKMRTILLTAFTSNVNTGLLSLVHEKGDPNGQRAYKSLSNYATKLDRFTSSIRSFLPESPDKQTFYFPLKPYDNWKEVEVFLRVLDLLGLVELEIDTGRGRSFEFYCKNRTMLSNIGNNYHNDLVTLINKRMKAKYEIAKDFYEKTESSEDRWRYLEKYFFGNPVSSGSSVYEHSDRVI